MPSKARNNFINLAGVLLVYLIVFFMIERGVFSRYEAGIIQVVCINIILAVSLNLVVGLLGQLALGHAGFVSVGAYACALFWLNVEMPYNMTYMTGLLCGGLVAALVGVLIGIPALRLRGDYLAIITLGFGEIIRVVINFLPFTGGAKGLRGIPGFIEFPSVYFIMALFICGIVTLIKSRHGRAIIAIREDEIAAEAAGIPTTFYKVFTFAVAAFMAGVAGGLLASYNRILVPASFGFMKSIEIVVMVVLGGMGSITGSVIAATVLTVLPEALRVIADYRMVVYSLLLILMMLFRPEGLLGRKEFSLTRLVDWALAQFKKLSRPQSVKGSDVPDRSPDAGERPLLVISHLGISFGGLRALDDVSLTVNTNEIVGLIGPNGAGKTTVFNLLTSVYRPTDGSITLDGVSLVGKKTYQITREGVARTFQNIRLFKGDTVIENVKTAFQSRMKYSILAGMLRLPSYHREELEIDRRARELLQVFDLERFADERADSLPYGAQRKLEIARALASNPKLLLLDEPAAGMNPIETQELMKTIQTIRSRFSVAILLIEHDMSLVMGICERILVLDYGQTIAVGTPEEIRSNARVIGAYLGGE
ncbi:branched-chain amino acid ABC transporter ATP-binding protein/permease [Eubacteriales bacterium OttesenSCG-928-A19]|nr:branched-chain amino acid ABC transporter ATP-binding protein/permease [Eubacteriales bacterium OttesenSCG-928-A19]